MQFLCHSMDIYTYAFLTTDTSDLEWPIGIQDTVQLVKAKRVSAVVETQVDLDALQDNDERLMQAVLAHDRVIGALFGQTPILPLRFGTLFGSLETLQADLAEREWEYLEKLERFAGHGQYTVKFIPLEVSASSTSSEAKGKQYLLAKKQRYQTQQSFRESQAAQWENIRSVIRTVYPGAIAPEPLDNTPRIYLLLPLQEEPLLHQRFKDWQLACPSWELQLFGALPPYDFI